MMDGLLPEAKEFAMKLMGLKAIIKVITYVKFRNGSIARDGLRIRDEGA